jgi:3-deoxy-D-manno-octulosonic-acid transferase
MSRNSGEFRSLLVWYYDKGDQSLDYEIPIQAQNSIEQWEPLLLVVLDEKIWFCLMVLSMPE